MTTIEAAAPTTAALDQLRGRIAGLVLEPQAPGYEEVRRLWNGAIDRRPAVIIRCVSASDVAEALRFARAVDLPVAVRGGGHSIPGLSTCDDGVLIDLQPMKDIRVHPELRTATAGAGVVWAELDRATQEHGLAVTGGEVSHTGIAGLTLGGGIGWLKRTCGLTCDNLLSAEVVTADGRIVRASADQNADLFWALRGGGGNFGIVTTFTYRLHAVGPIVYGGALVYPVERAAEVLRLLREQAASVPDEVSLMVALVVAPPAPQFPPHLQGQPVVVLAAAYHGPLDEGERALRPLRDFTPPAVDLLGPLPYVALQQMVDAANPHGLHYYVKSEWLGGLPDEVVDALVRHHLERTSPMSQILIHQMGGAVSRVPRNATPFVHRDASFVLTVAGCWHPGEPRDRHVEWTRSVWQDSLPGSLGAAYVNQLDADEGEDRVRAAYGPATYARLVDVKTEWDPDNVFRLNQNIRPRT
jgi:FAD/FMN-containing dehydrogenase